jgi:hypothetical protein
MLRRPGEREDRDAALAAILAGPLTGSEAEGRVRLDGMFAAKDLLGQSGAAYDQFLFRKFDRTLTYSFKPPASYGEKREYTERAADVVLTAKVDGAVYRPGEPVKVDVWFENRSEKWASIVEAPVGYTLGGEGWSVELREKGSGQVARNPEFKPPGFAFHYPQPQDLGGHARWPQGGCLQKALGLKALELPPGEYVLSVGNVMLGRRDRAQALAGKWDAPEVTFSVRGEAVQPGKEMVGLIGKKVGLADMEGDLTSGQVDHRLFAWEMLREYGDAETLAREVEAHPKEAAAKW